MQKRITLYLAFLFISNIAIAQDSLLVKQLLKNVETFEVTKSGFNGNGWNTLAAAIKKANNVLIGEIHFTKEVPYFTSQVAKEQRFDNFIFEIDPFSANILEVKLATLKGIALEKYYKDYGENFSFYASRAEYDLLKQLRNNGTSFIGTDQIIKIGDRLICSELAKTTKNKKAKAIYERIAENSNTYYNAFLKDKSKDFYIETDAFQKDIEALSVLNLSAKEQAIITAFKNTVRIFKNDDHKFRIQLMKHQLMQRFTDWAGKEKKNLYKYGAVHAPKGESLLRIYDVGNLVSNVADSHFNSSLHIMVVGMRGTSGAPFKGFPAQEVSYKGGILRSFPVFFNAVKGKQWHCFKTAPIWKAYLKGELDIDNATIRRILKGYDYIVVIPEVHAAVVEAN